MQGARAFKQTGTIPSLCSSLLLSLAVVQTAVCLSFEVLKAPLPPAGKPAVGKAVSLTVQLNDSIDTLKHIIAAELGVPVKEQRLLVNDAQLEGDERVLADCGVHADSTVHVAVRGRGGFLLVESESNKFVDVDNSAGLESVKLAPSAPAWRICDRGLNLEGKCTSSHCPAYGQMVIMKMGTGLTFDVIKEASSATTVCPCCAQFVKPVTCAFTACKWRWARQKGVRSATST